MTAAPALLPHRFAHHAATRPEAIAFRFVDRPGRPGRDLSWRELAATATATAAALHRLGLARQRVGVACDDARDFVVALAACLLSGNTVVPFPVALSRRAAPRARAIADAARPLAVILSPAGEVPDWLTELNQRAGTQILRVEAVGQGPPVAWTAPAIEATDLAIVQFSSGSTGAPKGVGLSHGNIAANCAAIVEAYGLTTETPAFCWLPLHHDMGLIGHVVTPLWAGFTSALMNPLRFLQRPLDWPRLMSQEGSVVTSAPNFAYEICAKAALAQGTDGIDLSRLTVTICGGEPVLPSTTARFLAAFAGVGLAPSVFAPSYGLAEATLLVASGRGPAGPRFTEVAAAAGVTAASGPVAAVVADLGPPVNGVSVRIVDANGSDVPEGSVGEIEIGGRSVGRLIDEAGRLAEDAPLRTGDLGFLRGGRVHVIGRKKDIIIVRGQNVHPADVEAAALEAHPAVIPGGIAAIGVAADGTENLVVLVEVDRKQLTETMDQLRRQVAEKVARRVGHIPDRVVALRAGALPRTSSGKVRRFEAAALFRANALAHADVPPAASEMAVVQ